MSERINYFCDESLRRDLKGRTVRGGALTGVAQAIKVFIGLATIPLLARLLDPEDFGLVAIVTVFTGFASMFVDAGLSTATVQRGDITHRQVSNLFWIATALGTLIAVIVSATAPAISWFYDEPRLTPITIALAVSFVMSGLTVQHQALMRRGMQFRELAIADVVSQVLAQVAGIAWAWNFYQHPSDYWALVLVPLIAAGIRMVLTWAMCSWVPGSPVRRVGTRALVVFGAQMTGGQFINYFARNADKALIGWFWGEAALGYFANAYRVLLFPLNTINAPITNVAIPALSRVYEDKATFRNAFRQGVLLLSTLFVPIVGLSIILAEPLILTVLGPKWAPAVPLFLALSPAALVATTAPATNWIYIASGRPDRLFRVTALLAPLRMVCYVAAAAVSPIAVAWTISAIQVLVRVPVIAYCFKETGLKVADQFEPMWRSVVASATAVLAVAGCRAAGFLGSQPLGELVYGSAAFAVAYFVGLAALPGGIAHLTGIKQLLLNHRRPLSPTP